MKWQISQITYNLCPNTAKNTYHIKKRKIASTKSCSELNFIQKKKSANFVQKSLLCSAYVYPPLLPAASGTEGLERLIWLKYLYCTEK